MAKSKTKKKKSRDINLDIIKRDAAERRREDIEAHGKPTALRSTKQKNKKAYSRKDKHKVSFATSDIMEMVEKCINEVFNEHDEWDANDDEWGGEDEFELEPEASFQDLSTVKKCTMAQYQAWVNSEKVIEFDKFPKMLKLTPYRIEENGNAIVYDAKTEAGMHWCFLGISGKDNVKWAETCRRFPNM